MIDVTVSFRPERCSMNIDGHSGSAPEGRDLICAGVTAIAYTAANALLNIYDSCGLLEPEIDIHSGHAEITACPSPDMQHDVYMVYWTVCCGLEAMAESYPENVRVKTVNRPEGLDDIV